MPAGRVQVWRCTAFCSQRCRRHAPRACVCVVYYCCLVPLDSTVACVSACPHVWLWCWGPTLLAATTRNGEPPVAFTCMHRAHSKFSAGRAAMLTLSCRFGYAVDQATRPHAGLLAGIVPQVAE
jgi:hypothetical protein